MVQILSKFLYFISQQFLDLLERKLARSDYEPDLKTYFNRTISKTKLKVALSKIKIDVNVGQYLKAHIFIAK